MLLEYIAYFIIQQFMTKGINLPLNRLELDLLDDNGKDQLIDEAPNDTSYKRWICHSGLKLLCKLCRTFPSPAMGLRFTIFGHAGHADPLIHALTATTPPPDPTSALRSPSHSHSTHTNNSTCITVTETT